MERSGKFKLYSPFKPAGDQPEAISALVKGFKNGYSQQTLLGVTGSGKTFTVANVIDQVQKPTLVIAHNKTLAAQLAQEYSEFFPDNAVHYFVSYYDYYQPEAYMAVTDTYIEKDASINVEIDRLRHASTQALLTRNDVIIVASVSCIYGLGAPEEYAENYMLTKVGDSVNKRNLIEKLVRMYYERTTADLTSGTFRMVGNKIEIMPISETYMISATFAGSTIDHINIIDPISSVILEEVTEFFLFPAKHFITDLAKRENAVKTIEAELKVQLKKFEKEGKLLEAQRLKRRTTYDLAMIKEIGYTNGIENYSRHLSGKSEGEPPETLLSYFPHDKNGQPEFLTVIDESHVTLPQLRAMYAGDQARKKTLVEYGFRLPSALDNRPLQYREFQERVAQTLYVSATPADYERGESQQIIEQVIRPTGLVDPELMVIPITAGLSVVSDLNRDLRVATSPLGSSLEGGITKQRKGKNKLTPEIESLDFVAGDSSYPGQVQHFIAEAEIEIAKGGRVLATTLTKKMAEDLSEYLKEKGIKTEYLHSDVKTIDRIKIITNFRKGGFDCLVGVNLLREGLDMPEVTFIGILDADKEGFLRSETSLVQTIGRAARNSEGRVILYADRITGSMQRAMDETKRRRDIQLAFNKKHGITPQTIIKSIKDITEHMESDHAKAVKANLVLDQEIFRQNPKKLIKLKREEMEQAVKELDFETAAVLRDEIKYLEEQAGKRK